MFVLGRAHAYLLDFSIISFSSMFLRLGLRLSTSRSSGVVPPQTPKFSFFIAQVKHCTAMGHSEQMSFATCILALLSSPSGKNTSVGSFAHAAFVTSNIALLICRPYIRIVFWFCTCIFWPIKLTVPFIVFCQ